MTTFDRLLYTAKEHTVGERDGVAFASPGGPLA